MNQITRFIKNVGCGFIFLTASVALPSLSFVSSVFVCHWISVATASFTLGLISGVVSFLLLVAISIQLMQSLLNNLPFSN